MKLYLAGVYSIDFRLDKRQYAVLSDNDIKKRNEIQFFLESYHYIQKGKAAQYIRDAGIKVFLDSGAYSALTTGKPIDLGRFCDFIDANRDIIELVSVLDDIDFDNPKSAVKKTYWNLIEMEKRGITDVMPCYHFGEPEEALQHYVANYDYITIGGLVGASTKMLQQWLDRIFAYYLTNGDGSLKKKVHLFGVTSLPLMLRYNATSIDSATWGIWSQYGMILLPRAGIQLNVSSRSGFRKVTGQHLDSVRPAEREALEQEIRDCGGDPDSLRTSIYHRHAWNCYAFPEYLRLRLSQKADRFDVAEQVLF